MTIDEFRALAETWGGDIARWPRDVQAAAEAFAQSPAARAILQEAQQVDALIAACSPRVSEERINIALLNVATAIADETKREPPRRSQIGLRWLVPAASFACAAVIGISLGVTHPLNALRGPGDATSILTQILDADALEADWVTR